MYIECTSNWKLAIRGYFQVGGLDPDSLIKYDTAYYYTSGDSVNKDTTKRLLYPRAGHCLVRQAISQNLYHTSHSHEIIN